MCKALIIDVGENVIMPGIIDSHVHVNEPGRTDWEGFETATKAAAAGGITTIVDMPLNSIPPTTTLKNFHEKLKVAEGKAFVDVAFWGGVIPGNADELISMVNAGVVGFKCFMCESGVEEFPKVTEDDIEKAMRTLEGTNIVLAFHAEVDGTVALGSNGGLKENFETFLRTRPPTMEIDAINIIIKLAQKYRIRVHIVHLSAAGALPLIAEIKSKGVDLTVETCHHYLSLKSEDVPNKATQYKSAPPIRDLNNQKLLWEALKNGTIDMVVSDHSPCTADLKLQETGDFLKAWGGISSVQFGLPLFWTQLKNRGLSIFDINKYMTNNPAKLVGLHNVKGQIAPNYDADLVIWNPHATITIEESMIQHKNKVGINSINNILYTITRYFLFQDNTVFGETTLWKSTENGCQRRNRI
ncbi:hypothetical protein FQR65_LT06505 [Abscondita terminalis]|nr:hypothetical protein FQR65_LT06505 [Abscondita terminalis]